MPPKKQDIYFFTALLLAVWFLLTAAVWVYMMNLIISYPAGIVSYILLRKVKAIEGQTKRVRLIGVILISGLSLSLIVLIGFLITN
ncbi:MAG TPA: hypothetical protein VGK59_04660 [Ohtaekwangia sp.]